MCARVVSALHVGSITAAWSRCSTRMCRPGRWTWRFVAAAAEAHGLRALTSLPWTPPGRLDRRGLAPATREAYGRVERSYLVFLETRGTAELDHADGASILAFLESLLDRWARSSLFWVVSIFGRS